MSLPHFRPPILSPAIEAKLRRQITPLWEEGLTGPEIAIALKFGEGEYEDLETYHVYYYRQKFDLPQRTKHYKFGKLGESDVEIVKNTMDVDTFKTYLGNIGIDPKSREFFNRRKRAYLILLFWSGLRKSEIYELKCRDFEVHHDRLRIMAVRKKKQKKVVVPLNLYRKSWGIDEAIDWIECFEDPHERPFSISSSTAWKYVKEMMEELYPHWFRANLVTKMADDPDMTIAKMRSWFGFSYATIEHYLSAQERLQRIEAMKMAKKQGDI